MSPSPAGCSCSAEWRRSASFTSGLCATTGGEFWFSGKWRAAYQGCCGGREGLRRAFKAATTSRAAERWNRLHPAQAPRVSHVEACLAGEAPIVAASDYIRTWPQLIAPYLGARFTALGTDGFGRSDTRSALRQFFEVDRHHVVLAALSALARHGAIASTRCAQAIDRYGIAVAEVAPWDC
jgi:pyruvate dehydrogenase complex dehydrogenase (E1) component